MVIRRRHEILAFERIDKAYDDVRAALLGNPLGILQRATTAALSGLFGAKLRVRVGPLEIASEIVVDIIDIEQCLAPNNTPATKLVIEWGAMHAPKVFPIMHATMSLHPLAPTTTALELRGTYRPPLGLVGAAADAIVLHRLADESVSQFVRDVARLLGHIASPEASPDQG